MNYSGWLPARVAGTAEWRNTPTAAKISPGSPGGDFPPLSQPVEVKCVLKCLKRLSVFLRPKRKPGLCVPPAACPAVTQPPNPVRPKWLRLRQALNLNTPLSDRLPARCTHHMVFITCVCVFICLIALFNMQYLSKVVRNLAWRLC